MCNNQLATATQDKDWLCFKILRDKNRCRVHCLDNLELSKKIMITFEKLYAFSCGRVCREMLAVLARPQSEV